MMVHRGVRRMAGFLLIGMLLLAAAVIPGSAHVAAPTPGPGWVEDPLVGWVHDHADVGVSPSLALFPGHDDVMQRVDALAEHPWMNVYEVGVSGEGRKIRLVEVIHPEGDVSVEERVVTLLLTQQHGNEPAGTPAALRLLEEIADGKPIAGTLRNQVLLVLPMANPDGAEKERRGNADGVDTNRDHNHLETWEAETMHRVLTDWRVHVALDHHEYGGTGLGNPFPLRVYDYDLTTLYPTHEGVHPSVLLMAKSLMYDGIWPLAESHEYTVNEYGVLTLHGIPIEQLAGGPDPGILRNHWGLHHIAGVLIESRIDTHPNPFHDAARREHIQYVTMVATLQYASDHAGLFIAARETAEREHAANAPQRYVEAAGESGALIPPAYLVAERDAASALELLAAHGLPSGVQTNLGFVHNVDHALPVHAAALMSDASSRRVIEGTPTDPVPVPGAAQDLTETTPGLGVAALLLVTAAFAGLRVHLARRRP